MPRFRRSGFAAVPLCTLLFLGGCSWLGLRGEDSTPTVTSVPANQFAVSDEPFATRAGAAILAQGGSAVDAATAIFFNLSVTYPVSAGLGSGGLCLVREGAGGVVREYDFLPHGAARGGAFAVPTAVRGFYDMQRRYGALPWARMVAGAQAFADAGFPISQALAVRIAGTENILRLDATLAGEFLDQSGQLKPAGTAVVNHDLALTLSAIRENGAAGLSEGQVGAALVRYAATQGGTIAPTDFAIAPRQVAARTLPAGSLTAAIPAAGTGAGAFAAALFARANNAASVPAAVRAALARFGAANVPADLGSTGFATQDANGQAVACAITLNGPFGSGRTAAGTGVTLAAAPGAPGGIASAFLLPVLAQGEGVTLAGAGAGGPNGAAAIAATLLRLGRGEAIGTPGALRSTGQAPRETINAIICQNACAALADSAGHGLGSAADTQ